MIRVGIKQREVENSEKDRPCLMKMTTPPLACVSSGENARPGVGAIRAQSKESRNSERGRRVKIGFLDADKVDRMGRKKV